MEIMGRGFGQIMQETPQYFHLLTKYAGWKLFKKRSPIFGSADIINVCNFIYMGIQLICSKNIILNIFFFINL